MDKKYKDYKPLFTCEKFKLLKVIGEDVVQVVESVDEDLNGLLGADNNNDNDNGFADIIDILKVDAELVDVSDFVFTDKVVKQGTVRLRVQFCAEDDDVECEFIDIPFEAVAEIPGVDPELELDIQNKLLNIETDFQIVEGVLTIKVVFDILIKASYFVQRKLKVCNTNVISHKQVK